MAEMAESEPELLLPLEEAAALVCTIAEFDPDFRAGCVTDCPRVPAACNSV